MDLALVMEDPPLLDVTWSVSPSVFVVPDHSAAGSFLKLFEWPKLDAPGFCRSTGTGGLGLLGSPGSREGAGLNGWTTGLVVCPEINLLDVL